MKDVNVNDRLIFFIAIIMFHIDGKCLFLSGGIILLDLLSCSTNSMCL